jgi:phospholipid/cholesterol/gamma-HCH transport system ATP-binding protein
MSLSSTLLNVSELSKRYEGHLVINGLSMSVEAGQCLCIVGRSGIGKSVLMRLLTGLEQPDGGAIIYFGKDYAGVTEVEWNALRRQIGLVFQQAALLDSLTVRDNLLLNLRGISPKAGESRCIDVLESVGLTYEALSKYPAQLSGGMRKRVGIARALIHDPSIIFYDEPTAGLDPVNAHRIDELIAKLHTTGRTSIIVTHDLATVGNLADTVLWLQANCQYQFSSVHEFLASDAELLAERTITRSKWSETEQQIPA